MALVGVAQPGWNPKKNESTFDKVLKGLQVAGQLVNVGSGLYDSFTKAKEAETNAEIAETNKVKAASDFAQTFEPIKVTDPAQIPQNAYKIKFNGQDNYYKLREAPLKFNEALTGFKEGYLVPLDRNLAEAAIKVGKDVRQTEGGLFVTPNPDAASLFAESHKLQLDKLRADIEKTRKETEGLGKDSTEKINKAADDLRKEFESKPQIREARDVIAIADKADELVKLNTVPAQSSLMYGWVRAQGPGIVSPQELDLAMRGKFSDELLNKFGWKRLADGRYMNDEQVRALADSLKLAANSMLKTVEPHIITYSRMAKERGINVDDVIVPLKLLQNKLFIEQDPSYLLKKDPKEMTPFEKELFQKNYGGGDGGSR